MPHQPQQPPEASFLSSSELDRLLLLATSNAALWRDEDLAGLLAAQLDLPLTASPRADGRVAPDPPGALPTRRLLEDPRTPLASLVAIKALAKGWQAGRNSMPRDVAHMIYLGAIAAALVHHGRRITSLGAENLDCQLSWALTQRWVDPGLRMIIRRARVKAGARLFPEPVSQGRDA